MKRAASIILGGGEGTRLFPLTLARCKPALNFGGKYRLIDIPISNSIHADCCKIFVLTQFLSSSLHKHICETYMQAGKSTSIEILAAEQRPAQKSWYQGTADAVRQNLDYLLECPVDYFLILSGDQLYNINFKEMMAFAIESDADVVVAALPVASQEAARMGVLQVNADHFITDFYEKPADKALLQKFKSPQNILDKVGIDGTSKRHYLGSMGIYLFKRKALAELLQNDSREDFGKHLIPEKVKSGTAAAYLYDGYWEDIGTIQAFYEANIALLDKDPLFDVHHEDRPIFSCHHHLPPAKVANGALKQAVICEGSLIEADEITNSLLGPRSVVHKGAIIRDSYIMGSDYYYSAIQDNAKLPAFPHIGENTLIKKAIIDKNVAIGKGVQLINKQKLTDYSGENIFIRDGVIVVPRGATIPDGFIL